MAITIEDLKKRAKELYEKVIKKPTEKVEEFLTYPRETIEKSPLMDILRQKGVEFYGKVQKQYPSLAMPLTTAYYFPLELGKDLVGTTIDIGKGFATAPIKVAKSLIELPEVIKSKGEKVPEKTWRLPVLGEITSYYQDVKRKLDDYEKMGLTPHQAAAATILGTGGEAILNTVFVGSLIESGAKALAKRGATAAEKVAAWQFLGYPESVEEANTIRKELAKQFHPDKLGGDERIMAAINDAYKILKEGGIPTWKDIIQARAGSAAQRLLSPVGKVFELYHPSVTIPRPMLPERAGYMPVETFQPTMRIPMGLSIEERKMKPIGKIKPVKQIAKPVIEQISKTTDEALIKNLIKEAVPTIHDDILEKIAPRLAKTKSTKRVKDILNKGLLEFMERIELGKLTPEQLKEVAAKEIKKVKSAKLPTTEVIPLKAPGTEWEIPERPALPPPAKIPQPIPRSDPVAKLIQFYKNVENAIKETEKLYKEERGRRAAMIARIGEKIKSGEIPGEQGYYMQLAALKGELPKVTPEMIRNFFSQEDINQLFKGIEDVDFLLPYQKIVAKTALRKLLMGSNVTKSELETLKLVYPEEFIRLLNENKQISSVIGETINIPRAVMASTDLSAPFKQGWFLIGRPEFWKAIGPEIKMAFSEEAYQGLMEEIMRRPTFKLMQEAGLQLTDIDAPILSKEEAYMGGQMAERIPFFGKILRGSNRAYVGFLNKLRADTFDSMVKDFAALGYDVTKLAPEIARFINNATGRGTLPQALNRFAPLLNATFFSPRLMASRINLLNPYFYISLPPPVRKYALESGLRALSIGLTVLGLAYLAGAKIEKDPRNPDFGKIRFGNSRWDIWGGFQQYIRTLAQLITGIAISSTTGKEIRVGEGYKPLTRWEILERFFETKTAPIASFIINVLKGETPVGGKTDIAAEVINRFIPMVIQDYFDLVREKGLLKGTIGIIPALFGVGLQTYGTQELVEGVSPLGKPTIEVRPRLDIGEYISEKLFGRKPLEPSKEYNVEAYYKQLKQMPPEMAAAISREIKEKNPDLYKKLQKVAKEEQMGIGPKEKTLKLKGVKSGERALAILKELKKLKTPEERAFLYKSLKEKKIITPEVEKQLIELLRQEGLIK